MIPASNVFSTLDSPSSRQKSLITSIDRHFTDFIMRYAASGGDMLRCAALLVGKARSEGHVCYDLSSTSGSPVDIAELSFIEIYPDLSIWRDCLLASGVVGLPGEFKPLILNGSRLYLYRYFTYESSLAKAISMRAEKSVSMTVDKNDLQEVAVDVASSGTITIISGGPGTGKTTTVAKIILQLVNDAKPDTLRIALSAPTGKAAARLKNAVVNVLQELDDDGKTAQSISNQAFTLHRLLGVLPHSSTFMHCAQNLLPYDVVIVDEASMVDMVMMASLFEALPLQTRVILLGDKDQLSSVEAGAVFSDICGAATENQQANTLGGRVVHLTKSYRFSHDSGIGRLAYCVNNGMVDEAWNLVCNGNCEDVIFKKLPAVHDFTAMIGEKVAQHFAAYSSCPIFTDAFNAFEKFRVLCGLRHGNYGVFAINRIAEKYLVAKGLIPKDAEWYQGKPVMITRNTSMLDLYNGDTGIVMRKPDDTFEVCFTGIEPSLTRSFYPLRIPLHETVYATTVHKSQGSEFENVLLVLPDADSPVLTRELLYTAITRAKNSIEIWCTESSFKNAVERRTVRMSGLRDALSVTHYTK